MTSLTNYRQAGFWSPLLRGIDVLAHNRLISLLLIFFISFAGNIMWAEWHGSPAPYVVDEFSHQLAGDTFSHLRVTNPPHAYPEFFDAFYILQRPTYMSIYPPGQGIFLGLGQIFFGKQIYGLWLSAGLMCLAICWMLYAWLPPRWALIGGMVAVMQFGVFTYWSQSYWGGPVSAIGGALVFGSLGRLIKSLRYRDSFWLGLGFAVLLISRPVEGFLLTIPVGCLVLPWKVKFKDIDKRSWIKKVALPLSLVALLTASAMGAYNKQITGQASLFPYVLYHQNDRVPYFIWQQINAKAKFVHDEMVFLDKENNEDYFLDKKTWRGMLHDVSDESIRIFMFFFGFPLAIPVVLTLIELSRTYHLAIKFSAAFLFLLSPFFLLGYDVLPHYFSPMTCLVVFAITSGLKYLSGLKKHDQHRGHRLVIYISVLQLIINIIFTPIIPSVRSQAHAIQSPSIYLPRMFTHEELKNILLKRKGRYLVFVKYSGTDKSFWGSWVYNDADIDHAPVVWAWDMGDHNRALINYFKDRQVLKVNVFWTLPGFWSYYTRP